MSLHIESAQTAELAKSAQTATELSSFCYLSEKISALNILLQDPHFQPFFIFSSVVANPR